MTTIYDVAKLAGVSHAAVSAVLNGRYDQVSVATRERIQKIVKDLDYRPSRIARQLKTGKYQSVAVCFARPSFPFMGSVSASAISGVIDAAIEQDIFVLISPAKSEQHFIDMMKSLASYGVGGVVIFGPLPIGGKYSKLYVEMIENCSVPAVCMDSYSSFKHTCTVDTDNYESMKNAIEYFISKGYKKISFLCEVFKHQCFVDRELAYINTMKEAGLPIDKRIVTIDDNSEIAVCAKEIISNPNKPEILICASRLPGEISWNVAQQLGIRIPDDIALLVVDGVTDGHIGTAYINALVPDFYNMGYTSFKLLSDVIEGKIHTPINVRLPAKQSFI